MLTTQKLNLWNYGICWLFRKAKPPCKNRPVGAYKHCYDRWLHGNPSKVGLVVHITIQINFRRFCMESSDYNSAYISPPIDSIGWFSARGLFPSCSFWICQPIPLFSNFKFLWCHFLLFHYCAPLMVPSPHEGKITLPGLASPGLFFLLMCVIFCPLRINKEGWRRKGQWLNSWVCMSTCKCYFLSVSKCQSNPQREEAFAEKFAESTGLCHARTWGHWKLQ